MSNQFDLEQQILECWHVVDDINLVYERSDTLTEDEIQNALLGMQQIYSMRFDKLFTTFESFIKEVHQKRV